MLHQTPPSSPTIVDLKPKITVIGVGGAGGNAVNNMIRSQLQGVEFVVCNTDAQSLSGSLADRRIQLGGLVTQGLGAGSRPEVGRAAAEESMDDILKQIAGSNMVFVTAGMGGGTGTGAAPVVAQAAREQGILTVGVVSKPFHFEGKHRMRTADHGIAELGQYVDTLIVIPNQNLFRVANEKTTFADAFKMADDVLYSGVRGVTDLMIMPGLINLDFADIRAVMMEMGKAMMGTGEAEGTGRSVAAAEAAISNPLLDDVSMKGARGVLINITGGMDMTLFEVDEAANRIREEVDIDANIIFGSTFDERMEGRIRVSVVATGICSADDQGRGDGTGTMTGSGGVRDRRTVPGRGFVVRPALGTDVPVADNDTDDDLFSGQKSPDAALRPVVDGGRTDDARPNTSPYATIDGGPQGNDPMPLVQPLNQDQGDPLSAASPDEPSYYGPHQGAADGSPHEAMMKPRKMGFFEKAFETMRSGRLSRSESDEKSATTGPRVTADLDDPHGHREAGETRQFYVATNTQPQSTDTQDPLDIPAYLRRGGK